MFHESGLNTKDAFFEAVVMNIFLKANEIISAIERCLSGAKLGTGSFRTLLDRGDFDI